MCTRTLTRKFKCQIDIQEPSQFSLKGRLKMRLKWKMEYFINFGRTIRKSKLEICFKYFIIVSHVLER